MLLGFKKRFVEPIRLGTKVHTLRDRRKNEPEIGDVLHMYTGLRTASCELISDKERLISKQRAWVRIVYNWQNLDIYEVKICVDGHRLSYEEKQTFYGFDGFISERDFVEFWIAPYLKVLRKRANRGKYHHTHKLVASKVLYHWTTLRY